MGEAGWQRINSGAFAQAVPSTAAEVLSPGREMFSLRRLAPWRRGLPFGSAFFHRSVADIQVVSLFPFIPLKGKAKAIKPHSRQIQKQALQDPIWQQGSTGRGFISTRSGQDLSSREKGGVEAVFGVGQVLPFLFQPSRTGLTCSSSNLFCSASMYC